MGYQSHINTRVVGAYDGWIRRMTDDPVGILSQLHVWTIAFEYPRKERNHEGGGYSRLRNVGDESSEAASLTKFPGGYASIFWMSRSTRSPQDW
jgi:hypothetical protein